MNYLSEEADKVFEVAKAIPVNRSIKAIPINISWFLFITLQLVFFLRSCGSVAAHHAAFSAMHLQGAVDFAEWRMRSWRRGAECSAFFGVAGFAPEPNI